MTAPPSRLPKSELRVLESQLSRALARCIADFSLIVPGDRVMVCLSGGKDSYTMLELLSRFVGKAPFDVELVAVHLDQGQPSYDGAPLKRWLEEEGYDYRVLREDTYSVVVDKVPQGKTYCSLCSRLRRGVLYNAAAELGCTKIALGHHRDDAIETLLLNLLYAGALAAMPPKLVSNDRRNVVVRPMLYLREEAIARYAELRRFPILPCDLCGSQEQLKRKQVKRLLTELEGIAPQARDSMLGALTNIKATHLLDRALWDALGLEVAREQVEATGATGREAPTDEAPAREAPADGAPAHCRPAGARRLPLLG